MTDDDKKEKYIAKLNTHINSCKEARDYAIGRFDILVISLSTGALGFTLNYVKDQHFGELYLMKFAWGFFMLTIVSNLTSQVTSYIGHRIEIDISNGLIKNKDADIKKLDGSKIFYSNATEFLNRLSFATILLGLIFTLLFIIQQ